MKTNITSSASLSAASLMRAARLTETIEARTVILNKLIAERDALLGSVTGAAPAPAKSTAGKRVMSAAARAKIAAGQSARWAKRKAGAGTAPAAANTPAPVPTATIATAPAPAGNPAKV